MSFGYRCIRYLLLLALFAVCDTAHAESKSLVVHDPRPVAKAVQRLETLYGLPVTYEDPQYVHESEVADVSVAARSVVSRLLQEFDIPLSWRLLYDPGLHWYVLNIHAVTPANK